MHTETKLSEHITSDKKLIDDQTKDVGLISTKGLTKELINRYIILNDAKYFTDGCHLII